MTNARAKISEHRRRIVAKCLVLGLLAAPLGGCQTSDSMSTGATTMPQVAGMSAGRAKLAFAPIVGAPASVSELLSSSVTSAIEKQHIPVSHASADVPDFTVRGYLVAAPDKAGTKLSYIWDVTDKTGQRAKRITGEEVVKGKKSKDPWAGVDQAVVDRIAADTSMQLAAWVPMQSGSAQTPPASAPAPQGASQSTLGGSIGQIFGFGGDKAAGASDAPATVAATTGSTSTAAPAATTANSLITGAANAPTAGAGMASLQPAGDGTTLIPPVTGAPGDGAQALTAALQRSLSGSGVKLASAGATGTYSVQGHVSMGQPAAGKQTIKIEWLVYDPAGKKVGTVSQNNVVPQGSLDGIWGKTADAAAAAAAQGVLKLLPHATASN